MKKKLLTVACCATLAFCAAFSGCSSSMTLQTYAEPLSFHTDIQKEFFDWGNPATLPDGVNGKTEYSIPNAIKLDWEDSKTCAEYLVEISENKDLTNALTLFTNTTEVDVYNLKIATTYYWRVRQNVKGGDKSKVGTFSTVDYGPRNLYVDGITNARDVGGWKTANGGRVQQGLLYRTGRLNNSYPDGWVKGGNDTGYQFEAELTEKGASVLVNDLKIKTEIDFRTRDRNGYPGTTDADETLFPTVSTMNYVSIPMDGGADVNDNKAAIKRLFETLAVKENYPILYHCNIGTDRTGMVTYLINALCGVSETDLYFDYMFSNFGLIALPTPQVTNPSAKELTDLTTGSGTAYRVSNYSGATLAEKAKNCLLDCGISESTIEAVKDIMLNRI